MADTPFEIDFASLKSQAAEMMDAPDTAVVDTPIVETPVVSTPAVVAAVVTPPAEVTPVGDTKASVVPIVPVEELDPETMGDRLVRVKVDGNWEVKALKDVAAGYSRTSHFTRQMQDLAAQRKEVEGFRAEFDALKTERTNISAFLNDGKLVHQFLKQQNPELFELAQQPIVGDPNEIATVQQARDLIAAQALTVKQAFEKMATEQTAKLADVERQIEDKRATAVHIESINAVIKDIFEKNPLLHKVRMAEDVMRFEVSKLQPKTIAEALEGFRTVAQGMVEDLSEGIAASTKTKVVAAAKLTTARIEPPGGAGPQIQPTDFKRADGTLDWKKLRIAAENYSE